MIYMHTCGVGVPVNLIWLNRANVHFFLMVPCKIVSEVVNVKENTTHGMIPIADKGTLHCLIFEHSIIKYVTQASVRMRLVSTFCTFLKKHSIIA